VAGIDKIARACASAAAASWRKLSGELGKLTRVGADLVGWSGRPATPSRPASAAWRRPGAGVEVGADDGVDERSRVSASR
jgi:hypothetical protein